VRALRHWLAVSENNEGPVFRAINRHGQLAETRLSEKAVALIAKRACRLAGLDPDRYAGHSLRSGLATSAAEGDGPYRFLHSVAPQMRHLN
jgi:integrase